MNILTSIFIQLAVLLIAAAGMTGAEPKAEPEVVVSSNSSEIVTPQRLWMGIGFNWSCYEGYCNPNHYFGDAAVELTEEQWATVFRRVNFMRLKFIRLMSYSSGYLRGRDPKGEPIYVFREKEPNLYLRNVYRILDWAQANDVHIFMGDWQMGTLNAGVKKEDPFAVRVQADFAEHLVRDKKYTCIKWWCSGNEEAVSMRPGILAAWVALSEELNRRKLDIKLAGPDNYMDGVKFEDLKLILEKHPSCFAAYENHFNGAAKPDIRERELIDKLDPDGAGKPWFAGEAVYPKSWNNTHGEAIANTKAYIEHLKYRSSGVLHWMLDTSQYREHRLHGVWRITTGEVFTRFYPLALFSRLFWAPGADGVGGGEIIRCTSSDPGVSAAAIARPNGDQCDLSYVLVNTNATQTRRVILRESQSTGLCDLAMYCYDEKGISCDENGLPKTAAILRGIDLAKGANLELPPTSAVFLTTDDGGTPMRRTVKAN